MKVSDWDRFVDDKLGDLFNGWARVKGTRYIEPVGWLLRGVTMDSSSFSATSIYVAYFVQPLYVPDFSHLAISKRIRGRLDVGPVAESESATVLRRGLAHEAMPFLRQFDHPAAFAAHLIARPEGLDDARRSEAIAYSYLLTGAFDQGEVWLQRLEDMPDLRSAPWVHQIKARAAAVRTLLQDAPADVLPLLSEWRDREMARLGLTHGPKDAGN